MVGRRGGPSSECSVSPAGTAGTRVWIAGVLCWRAYPCPRVPRRPGRCDGAAAAAWTTAARRARRVLPPARGRCTLPHWPPRRACGAGCPPFGTATDALGMGAAGRLAPVGRPPTRAPARRALSRAPRTPLPPSTRGRPPTAPKQCRHAGGTARWPPITAEPCAPPSRRPRSGLAAAAAGAVAAVAMAAVAVAVAAVVATASEALGGLESWWWCDNALR